MMNLEQIISKTNDDINNEVPIDTEHKKSREMLQGKLNKTSEIIREKLEAREKLKNGNDELNNNGVEKFKNGKLGNVSNVTCLAHSLCAYLITANQRNEKKLKDLTVKIYSAVNDWLSKLFRSVKFFVSYWL